MLGSHSRLHGSTVYRVPWLFDEEDEKNGVALVPGQTAVDVVREFTKLKLELMPYVYQLGLQPHVNGTPVMRSMFVEFPDDPACRTLDRQYMFGPSMLVAPPCSPIPVRFPIDSAVGARWQRNDMNISAWCCNTSVLRHHAFVLIWGFVLVESAKCSVNVHVAKSA